MKVFFLYLILVAATPSSDAAVGESAWPQVRHLSEQLNDLGEMIQSNYTSLVRDGTPRVDMNFAQTKTGIATFLEGINMAEGVESGDFVTDFLEGNRGFHWLAGIAWLAAFCLLGTFLTACCGCCLCCCRLGPAFACKKCGHCGGRDPTVDGKYSKVQKCTTLLSFLLFGLILLAFDVVAYVGNSGLQGAAEKIGDSFLDSSTIFENYQEDVDVSLEDLADIVDLDGVEIMSEFDGYLEPGVGTYDVAHTDLGVSFDVLQGHFDTMRDDVNLNLLDHETCEDCNCSPEQTVGQRLCGLQQSIDDGREAYTDVPDIYNEMLNITNGIESTADTVANMTDEMVEPLDEIGTLLEETADSIVDIVGSSSVSGSGVMMHDMRALVINIVCGIVALTFILGLVGIIGRYKQIWCITIVLSFLAMFVCWLMSTMIMPTTYLIGDMCTLMPRSTDRSATSEAFDWIDHILPVGDDEYYTLEGDDESKRMLTETVVTGDVDGEGADDSEGDAMVFDMTNLMSECILSSNGNIFTALDFDIISEIDEMLESASDSFGDTNDLMDDVDMAAMANVTDMQSDIEDLDANGGDLGFDNVTEASELRGINMLTGCYETSCTDDIADCVESGGDCDWVDGGSTSTDCCFFTSAAVLDDTTGLVPNLYNEEASLTTALAEIQRLENLRDPEGYTELQEQVGILFDDFEVFNTTLAELMVSIPGTMQGVVDDMGDQVKLKTDEVGSCVWLQKSYDGIRDSVCVDVIRVLDLLWFGFVGMGVLFILYTHTLFKGLKKFSRWQQSDNRILQEIRKKELQVHAMQSGIEMQQGAVGKGSRV